ncbi:MAG TPA: hypothetical protein VFO93_09175 [Hymenobacter sp.]|uniref:hypothetical protein n=1 Tax=Hymenobacter sp. TaxID=1898978 RepID=UPI002D80F70A|nr:hypothetical protein [Hymenobacter sp.]HET9503701.1 hypothetical protein [Hymenobacter sp.]
MAYSDFTLDRLIREFGVKVRGERSLFTEVVPREPSAWLVESLARANNIGFGSEKSRSERLVSPVLMELSNLNHDSFAIISGANLDIDASRGLNGECDFILSFTRLQDLVQAPIFCITEAKKQDVEMGTAQCAAQLLGAAQLNSRAQQPIVTLYGCSTTGLEWRFLRLELETMTLVIDETRYLINETARLLGVLQQILDWQLFALRSEPLEGLYYAVENNTPHALLFHRDGRFFEAREQGGNNTPAGLRAHMDKLRRGGRYELKANKLVLHYDEGVGIGNKFPPYGHIDEENTLRLFRYKQDEPVAYQLILP